METYLEAARDDYTGLGYPVTCDDILATYGGSEALQILFTLSLIHILLDPSEVGGTPFLGISRPVIKAHGSSNARAIRNAILRAREYAESGFIADVERDVALMKVERTAENV